MDFLFPDPAPSPCCSTFAAGSQAPSPHPRHAPHRGHCRRGFARPPRLPCPVTEARRAPRTGPTTSALHPAVRRPPRPYEVSGGTTPDGGAPVEPFVARGPEWRAAPRDRGRRSPRRVPSFGRRFPARDTARGTRTRSDRLTRCRASHASCLIAAAGGRRSAPVKFASASGDFATWRIPNGTSHSERPVSLPALQVSLRPPQRRFGFWCASGTPVPLPAKGAPSSLPA
jgi:hypothetical protein